MESAPFVIEDVAPDRLKLVQWHFIFVPALAPTVRLVAYEVWDRPSTKHRFRDVRAWYHPEAARRKWKGETVARPDLPQAIEWRVRTNFRSYFVFE